MSNNENPPSDESAQAAPDDEKALKALRAAADAQQNAFVAQQQAIQAQTNAYLEEQKGSHPANRVPDPSRRTFLKFGAGAVTGAAIASAVQIPLYTNLVDSRNNTIQKIQGELSQADQQVAQLQGQVGTLQTAVQTATGGFLTLSNLEQTEVEAIVETIIPSDSSGPGAKEAGVIYFIDHQLAGDYGHSGNMFMDGPFVMAGLKAPVTVGSVTYPSGTPNVRIGAGTRYQYPLNMREFWRTGLIALEDYSNSAYGGNFESLSSTQQLQVLKDLWSNVPTTFGELVPQDFAYELTFMAWSGFLMDPLYGGNQNMVGWAYTGYSGVNQGDAYNEGLSQKDLMVATTPTRLKPASLAQFQNPSSTRSSGSGTSGQTSAQSSSESSSSSSSSSSGGT